MEKPALDQLIAFNQLHKEMDIMYHNYAKSVGLSDTAFWILYCVSERNGALTQRELCTDWSYAPQTINSALKELEKRGIVRLELLPGNRRNKQICLTQDGQQLMEQSIAPLMSAELASFAALGEANSSRLLSITEKHISILKDEIGKLQTE